MVAALKPWSEAGWGVVVALIGLLILVLALYMRMNTLSIRVKKLEDK